MSFEVGAWIAGILGALAGLAGSRISGPVFRGAGAWLDRIMGMLAGAFLSLLAYAALCLMEGWAAFFNRRASPLIPLLLTVAMLAGWLLALWVRRSRNRRPAPD